MRSLEVIKAMSREAAARACREGAQPFTFDVHDVKDLQTGDRAPLQAIPNVGEYLAPFYVRVRVGDVDHEEHGVFSGDADGYGAYFVDSSGFGGEGDSALSIEQFMQRVQPGYAYAIVEQGQFQIKIGMFRFTA